MPRTDNLYELPENLPLPVDDGATNHLFGMQLPAIPLMSTAGIIVDLGSISGTTIVYCYPRTGTPDQIRTNLNTDELYSIVTTNRSTIAML
ncbi:MAG: hypothetical protein P2A85_28360 [Microcoleus anatoxicus]|uniref:hypothetical protein n=1 Tax=Microcoleus anatoxicus TaxID=2705319 RepID=UPI00366A720A